MRNSLQFKETRLKIKVCGMKYPENINDLCRLSIDMIGFIFYPESKRYVGNLNADEISNIPERLDKVGVFVNENEFSLLKKAACYHLDIIQLHGNELPEKCYIIKKEGYRLIKAFNISKKEDFDFIKDYADVCDYFLFDTKTGLYGGSGKQFDWDVLNEYKLNKPFFLSGGITSGDIDRIYNIQNEQLYAIDINSCFEMRPGLKNIELIKKLINKIK